ncbi:MAG: hypothetical protein M1607_02120 [Patescibacteria group bacterium]|nr:hypothetical protein [Patescibacteria group bacterium]
MMNLSKTTKKLMQRLEVKPLWLFIVSTPLFIYAFIAYRGAPSLEFQLLTLAAIFYVMLAILSHHREKTLSLEIVIEYVLIAALALIVLQGLTV